MGALSETYRLVHLCDLHLDEKEAVLDAAVRSMNQALKFSPNHIITGGDAVRDALKDPAELVEKHWRNFDQFLQQLLLNGIPVHHVLGNHDIDGGLPEDIAKNQALNAYRMELAYYSFETPFWQIVVLDSNFIVQNERGYEARLDQDQLFWLENILNSNHKPVCLISHIPLLSAAAFLDGDLVSQGNWIVPGAWMHLDSLHLTELFNKYPRVKLCLSGHLHLHEQVHYNGVTYVCNGAISGNWWEGTYRQTPPGFGVVDLNADGTFTTRYIPITY